MDYVVTEEMGHARGDIVGDFFGHVMCGVESFALNPFGPLTPEAKRVKASFDYSAFRPERQDGHVEFWPNVPLFDPRLVPISGHPWIDAGIRNYFPPE